MDDNILANNEEESFAIDRHVRWRLLTCPVCDAARFRTYRELIYHLVYPPNCFNGISQHNQLPEDVQIGPVMVPIFFPLRLILMLIWSVLWLIYQVCHFTIVAPIMYTYNTIASVVLYTTSLPERYYHHVREAFVVPAVPADELLYQTYHYIIEAPATYIYDTVRFCAQFIHNLFGRLYQDVMVVSAVYIDTAARAFIPNITGSFERLYQKTRRICTNTIVPFGWFILRLLYPVYHYILEIPYIYTYEATSSVALCIASISGRVYERCTDAIALIFWSLVRTFYPVYHHIIKIPFVLVCNNYIGPFVSFALYMFAVPRRIYQFAIRIMIDRFAHAVDRFIGSERASVQRVFISVETRLGQIHEDIDKLNLIMYTFVSFPVDIPRGTAFWIRFTYYAFFCIHFTLLLYMCACCYLQLAVLFVSKVVHDE